MFEGTEIGIHIVGPNPPDSSMPVRLYAVVEGGEQPGNGNGDVVVPGLNYEISEPLIQFDIGSQTDPAKEPNLGSEPEIHSNFIKIWLTENLVWCRYKLYIKCTNAKKGQGEGYRIFLPREYDPFLPVPGEEEPCANAALYIAQGQSPHLFDGSIMWTTRKWDEQGQRGKFIWYFDHDEWGANAAQHPKPWALGDHTATGAFTMRNATLDWLKVVL